MIIIKFRILDFLTTLKILEKFFFLRKNINPKIKIKRFMITLTLKKKMVKCYYQRNNYKP